MGANTTVVFTNTAPGQELRGYILGAAAGGTDYTAKFVPNTGQLLTDGDDTNGAPSIEITKTIPAGSRLEFNADFGFAVGTNAGALMTRLHKL
jgi:hypothetical protein